MSDGLPYTATEQHIRLLQEKRKRLTEALVNAEQQYIAAVARELRAGRIDATEARRAFHFLRDGDVPGTSKRWREEMPEYTPRHLAQAARQEQRAPEPSPGVWTGMWPLHGEDVPPRGRAVVYVLFLDGAPCYVGSTEYFAQRLSQHEMAEKRWTTWQAHACRDREQAYEAENRFLEQYMPHLNVAGPRRPPRKGSNE